MSKNNKLEGLERKLDLQAAQVEVLAEQLVAANTKIATLESQLAAKSSETIYATQPVEQPLPSADPFEVDGVMYRFVYPRFIIGDGVVLAHEAAHDPGLCAYLVQNYPTTVQQIEE